MEATPTRDREHEGGDADWVVGVGVVVGEQVEWAPCRGEPQSQCSGGEGQSGEPQLCGLPSPRNGEFARRKRPEVRAAICRRRESFPPGAQILLAGHFLDSAAFSPLKVFCAHLKTFVDLFAFLAFELFVRPTRDYRVERVVRLGGLGGEVLCFFESFALASAAARSLAASSW